MEFEYDPNKSASNKAKHGIDFEEAQRLWSSPVVSIAAKTVGDEVRIACLGLIDGKHWTVITTKRGEAVRIISARRSREGEEAIYDGQIDER